MQAYWLNNPKSVTLQEENITTRIIYKTKNKAYEQHNRKTWI